MPTRHRNLSSLAGRILRKGGKVAAQRDFGLTAEQRDEFLQCSPSLGSLGFARFCEQHIRIYDPALRRDVPLRFFDGQRRIVPDLVAGVWILALKGRQVGFTTLIAAFVVWRMTTRNAFTAAIVFHQRQYAEDFIDLIRYMHDRLPAWLQKRVTRANKSRFRLGKKSEVRAIVGGSKAARSIAADLIVIDEASRVDKLEATMQAVIATVDVAQGQIIELSSSAGPQGHFYSAWVDTFGEHGELIAEHPNGVGPTGFKPFFIHWSERPGRDAAWYAREELRLRKLAGPTGMKQEHPNNPQEAWEHAAGRVYPLFTRERGCVGKIGIPDTADRFRAIDFGQTDSPFVCLWCAHIKGPTGLLVSPDCPNTIREMYSYRWDDENPNQPYDDFDHCPDALRYLVVTFPHVTGLVYVYRELYVTDSVKKGWNVFKEIETVHQMSGWQRAAPPAREKWEPTEDGELYYGTVADRSWPLVIATFAASGIPCRGHEPIVGRKSIKGPGLKTLTDHPRREIVEGIARLSMFIDGSERIDMLIPVTRESLALAEFYQPGLPGHRITESLRQRRTREYARRLLMRSGSR